MPDTTTQQADPFAIPDSYTIPIGSGWSTGVSMNVSSAAVERLTTVPFTAEECCASFRSII